VRAASAYVAAVYGALLAAGFGRQGIAIALGLVALVAFLPIWAKWRFHPARLPVALLAPFGLVGALVRGWWRATSRRSRPGTRAGT